RPQRSPQGPLPRTLDRVGVAAGLLGELHVRVRRPRERRRAPSRAADLGLPQPPSDADGARPALPAVHRRGAGPRVARRRGRPPALVPARPPPLPRPPPRPPLPPPPP